MGEKENLLYKKKKIKFTTDFVNEFYNQEKMK